SLAFGNPLNLDGDTLDGAFDSLQAVGEVGRNRCRRRAAALDAPRPSARERKEHQAQHAEYDRYDEEVLSHGEFSRDDPGRGSAPAFARSPRSESSLVRKRWFSEMRSTSIATESIARSMRSIRSADSTRAVGTFDWFSIFFAHAFTSTSTLVPANTTAMSAPMSSGDAAIIPPLRWCVRGRQGESPSP